MKQIGLIILAVFLTSSAYGLDMPVTSQIANEADQLAVRIDITRISVEDSAVWATLYDAEDNVITTGRVYAYEGDYKDIPATLLDSEKEFLNGQKPTDLWDAKTARLYMKSKQARAEDGTVVADDPYIISDSATIAEIISQLADMEFN